MLRLHEPWHQSSICVELLFTLVVRAYCRSRPYSLLATSMLLSQPSTANYNQR